MMIPKIYTCESVTIGHPDKICDQISDAILDEVLRQDPKARVAVEVMGGHGLLVIMGEITSVAKVDFTKTAKEIYRQCGYDDELQVIVKINQQSSDIALGVNIGGAGDQGIMYGFATDETPEFLPLGLVLAHRLTAGLKSLRQTQSLPYLKPDGKTQVTIKDGLVSKVLVSTQHQAGVSLTKITADLMSKLIKPIINQGDNLELLINPTGKFVQGGFVADTGLTGRKIMVDTYGGLINHGGGAFSGKDATKVDRSAAYLARLAAKNLVANGYGKQCLVSVAYAIGLAEPVMLNAVNEQGQDLSVIVKKHFDFRPSAIIERLGLTQPIYLLTAQNGHFSQATFSWEKLINF